MHTIISLLFFYHTAGCLLKGNFVHLCGLVRTCLWRDFGRLDWCVWCVPCVVCCGFRANVRYIRGCMHTWIHWTAWRMRPVTRIFLYLLRQLRKPGNCPTAMRRAGQRHWTTWGFVHSCGWTSSMQPVCSERLQKPVTTRLSVWWPMSGWWKSVSVLPLSGEYPQGDLHNQRDRISPPPVQETDQNLKVLSQMKTACWSYFIWDWWTHRRNGQCPSKAGIWHCRS